MQAIKSYDDAERLKEKKMGDTGLVVEADAFVICGVRKNGVGRLM